MPRVLKAHQHIGRFEVLGEVGPGRRGLLFRARDDVTGQEVALELCGDPGADPAFRARCERAVHAAAGASHRLAARVHETGEQDGRAFFVAPWPTGKSLADSASGTFLSVSDALRVVAGICVPLQAAHENGVVHGDLHPGHVWIEQDGSVSVRGFGTSVFRPPVEVLRQGPPGGASGLAPEQVTGQPVDGRADVFTAGAILYELLSGRPPFEGNTAADILDQVATARYRPIQEVTGPLPSSLVAAVDRALARNPDDRYPSAFHFAADLQAIRTEIDKARAGAKPPRAVVRAPSATTPPVPPHPLIDTMRPGTPATGNVAVPRPRPRPVVWVVLAVIVLLALIAGAMFVTRSRTARPAAGPPASSGPVTGQQGEQPPISKNVQAPPPVALKTIQLSSTPAGAQVTVNGQRIDQITPATLELPADKAVGTRVRVTKPGFLPADVRLDAAALADGSVNLTLAPEPNRISVELTGQYPFAVFDGTKRVSMAATSHALTALEGATLRVVADEYFLDTQVRVRPTAPGRMSYAVPGLGPLSIRAGRRETCSLFLNDANADTPPFNRKVAAGRYEIRLACPGGERRTFTTVVREGQQTIFTIP